MESLIWHNSQTKELRRHFSVDLENGLASHEAKKRRDRYGANKLPETKRISPMEIFLKQFADFMVLVLLAATAISALLGETVDAIAILTIVVLNATMGFVQEFKAERSLESLRQLTAPKATVRRDGRPVEIEAQDIVPGDVVLVEAGDRVPADVRLVDEQALETDESPLTGESLPVTKEADWVGKAGVSIGDRRNMLYMGTVVTRGRGRGIAVGTGTATEIGQIAAMIQDVEASATPLQRRLEQLGKWLVAACLVIVAMVFAAGVLRGFPIYKMFLTGVSLAVAAIPEGLPAVVTIALALGVQRMIKRNAIVRKLPAVETLGCATVICSDKTGTLTKNEMTVREVWADGTTYEITGTGYTPRGQFLDRNQPIAPLEHGVLRQLVNVCGICNHAEVYPVKKGALARLTAGRRADAPWELIGDPTEGALRVLAEKAGLVNAVVRKRYGIKYEVPFDSDRKRMTVVTVMGGRHVALTKGAPDVVLPLCSSQARSDGSSSVLGRSDRTSIERVAEKQAARGLRVLAVAVKDLGPAGRSRSFQERTVEDGSTFVGLVAMMDPPRDEVRQAIVQARRAGIRTVMVTGDHALTASAISRQLGLAFAAGDDVVTGAQLDRMSDQELKEIVDRVDVFARVSPRHKLRIVRSLKDQGDIVAMTGDGVNDAPAVKEADIGISMGQTGTDVTKEASAMVLADDNYATIVAAIEEGRGIYDNIRKFIRYLLGCNVGEVLTMFLAALGGLPMPLLPIQILWMNLVTDGLPAIALGVDPVDKDVMKRSPRPPNEGVFARRLHLKIMIRGVLIATCTLGAFGVSWLLAPGDVDRARTLAFTTLVMSQLFYVFQCRSESRSLFEVGILSNPYLVVAVLISAGMHLGILYHPLLQPVFRVSQLSLGEWGIVLALSGWSLVFEGLIKVFKALVFRRISIVRG